MKLVINGEETEFNQESLTIAELLKFRKVEQPDMVSVELNGEFAQRPLFGSTALKTGDRIEFLYFMGGGSSGSRSHE